MWNQSRTLSVVLFFLILLIPVSQSQTNTTTNTSVSTTDSTISTIMSSTNWTTSNYSSPNTTMSDMTTTVMTTTTTASTMPPFDLQHDNEIALFVLKLTVGQENGSHIQYMNTSLTRTDLLDKLRGYFINFSFAVDLVMTSNSSQAPGTFILRVEFLFKDAANASQALEEQIQTALSAVGASMDFTVPNITVTENAISEFIIMTMDVCAAENICPLGFTCVPDGCQHMCRQRDCSSHGVCYASVASNTSVTTMCQCDSGYETEYLGDNCENSRRGRLQIIAIIAGVLGAACLVFIVIIIILCIKYSRRSSSNYNISRANYTNNAYDNNQEK